MLPPLDNSELDRVDRLIAELKAIDWWDADYGRNESPREDVVAAFHARQERRAEIISKITSFQEINQVTPIAPFYWRFEFKTPLNNRVHHNNDSCSIVRVIPAWERVLGTGDYALCKECEKCNAADRLGLNDSRLKSA